MIRKVASSGASLALAAVAVVLTAVQVCAQENVPVSVSLTVPEDAMHPPTVISLPASGIGMDVTNILFGVMVVVGLALTYVGMLNLRRVDY